MTENIWSLTKQDICYADRYGLAIFFSFFLQPFKAKFGDNLFTYHSLALFVVLALYDKTNVKY
jgi:hypothetical protein